VAERAGMSPMTLRSLERGGSGVTMGAYLSVMQVLGIEQDLNLLGKFDPLGRELQDSQLPGRTKTKKISLSIAIKTPATSKRQLAVGDAAAKLHHVIKNSPAKQILKLPNSMPNKQIRKAIEAPAIIPSVHLRESIDQKNTQDWIKKSGFASSETLSNLIDLGKSLKKTRG
jgi:transcriptional regulator with XRE-family HTH domain